MAVLLKNKGGKTLILQHPAIIYNSRDHKLLAWTEQKDMHRQYREERVKFIESGRVAEAQDICMMPLPQDQHLIDELLRSENAFSIYIEKKINRLLNFL